MTQKQEKKFKKQKKIIERANPQKMSRGMPILAVRSSTRSLQFNGKQSFRIGTDRHTDPCSLTSQLKD